MLYIISREHRDNSERLRATGAMRIFLYFSHLPGLNAKKSLTIYLISLMVNFWVRRRVSENFNRNEFYFIAVSTFSPGRTGDYSDRGCGGG